MATQYLPLTDLCPALGATLPPPDAIRPLVDSVKTVGVQLPILVRPCPPGRFVVQEGRWNGRGAWLVLDATRIRGRDYLGTPAVFRSRAAARAAMANRAAYEIVDGHKRLVAIKTTRIQRIPAVIADLDDTAVQVIRDWELPGK